METNTRMTLPGIGLTLLALALASCTGPAKVTKAEQVAPAAPAAPATPAASGLSGKVVETMDAGGYTYLCLEKDGNKTWIAAPVMKISVGQELKLLPGAEMSHFASKALNRTFDKIVFSGGLDQPALAPVDKTVSQASFKESEEPVVAGKIVETMDAGQYTYIRLEKDGKSAWSAVPTTTVTVGDEIELLPGSAMGKFESKTLKRTFNAIYFSGGVKGAAAQPLR